MRNKRLVFAITGAVICGLLGVMLVTRYLASVQTYAQDLGNVVVAKTEISLGEKITAEQLTLTPMPNASVPAGAFKSIDQVVGRVAIMPIGVLEQVTSLKLAPAGMGAGLPAVIPEGFRAMTVKVDEVVGVSGFVMPGSFVDVVAVIVPATQQSGENAGPISKTVLQNIKVLASGAKLDSPENQREPNSAKAVTLQVTPEQAEILVLAVNEGRLQLIMRNYSDQEDTETRGASKRTLLGNSYFPHGAPPKNEKADRPKPAPAKPPVQRVSVPATQGIVQVVQPVRRNSVELIEGAKRRDVDIP